MPHYGYFMPPIQPPQPRKPTPFGRADWLIFALAGIEALLLIITLNIDEHMNGLPGVGLTLMIYGHLGIVALALGKKARYDRTTIPLILATLLLGAFPTIYGNETLRLLNLLVVWALITFTTFLMANVWESAKIRLDPFISSITTWIASIFSHILRPIDGVHSAWQRRNESNHKNILPAALGILFALVALTVVLPLLFSADTIFAEGFSNIIGTIFSFDPATFTMRSFTLLVAWPAFFGILWGLARTTPTEKTAGASFTQSLRRIKLPAVTAIIVLATLILVYAAFIWVQAVYLFGGRAGAMAAGSYSEYARSGFFQLVTVAAINSAVALLAAYSAHKRPGEDGGLSVSPIPSMVVRAGVILLLVQTGVILASALTRMNLYVGAYGLSLLRMLTYLGMLFIAICLLVTALYTFRAQTPVFTATFVTGIALWAAFNLVNPEMRIATYNVNHYLSGDMEELDLSYFYDFSPAVAPVLEDFQSKYVSHEADDLLENYHTKVEKASWQEWCLPFLEIGEKSSEKSHSK